MLGFHESYGYKVPDASGSEATHRGVAKNERKGPVSYTHLDSNALADRLTEWRLGAWVKVDKTTNDIDAAVNTPSNMFVYNIENGMYYLRAARIENVNEGTLFYQNIRLMKNPNTKERTVYFPLPPVIVISICIFKFVMPSGKVNFPVVNFLKFIVSFVSSTSF